MGMYNPTNTRCQMMSYLDTDAPQYMFGSRQSFYEFLDKVLTEGYNTQPVLSLTLEELEGEQVIKLSYEAEHGYRVGQLIKISGSNSEEFNGIFRVVRTDKITELYLGNLDNSVQYPQEATGSIVSKVSPLDWEIVYSTQNQRSYRSKMPNSSRNILSFRYPRHKILQRTNSCVVHEISVSRDIDLSNGLDIDSHTSSLDYTNKSSNDNKPYGALYFIQHGHNYSNITYDITPSNTARVPWYIVGDGRIFYFISINGLSSNPTENGSYINYGRNPTYTERYSFVFGDPNSLDESDIYNGNGSILSTLCLNDSLTSYLRSDAPRFGANNSSFIACCKNYLGNYSLQQSNLTSIVGGSFTNFGSSFSQKYPNIISGGFVYFPYYLYTTSVDYNIRAEIPYSRYCPQGVSEAFPPVFYKSFDWNPIRNTDGSFSVNIANYDTSYNLYNSFAYNVGK